MSFKELKLKSKIFFTYVLIAQRPFDSNLKEETGNQTEAFMETSGLKGGEFVFSNIVSNVIMALLALLGLVFVGLIVYGGFQWMTAKGNEQQATEAKNTITHAVWGIVITLSAYAIAYFVLSFLMGDGMEAGGF